MENKVSLLDIKFKELSMEEKRAAFVLMDLMLKRLHQQNFMVTDFRPSQIYFQNGIFSFERVVPINNYYIDNKERAVLRNVLGLSNLALCSYLPDYQLGQGLLSYDVVNQKFKDLASFFPEQDRDYYKSILVDSYDSKTLPSDLVYYSDYVIKQQKSNANNNVNSLAYIKATEAGRAFAIKDDEAAFGNKFFLITVVASLTVLLIGTVLYFFGYLG